MIPVKGRCGRQRSRARRWESSDMSVGSSTGITFGGLGSGIDTDSIIQRLMQLEQNPINRLKIRQQELRNQQQVQQVLKSQVQKLSGAASGLNAPGVFNPMRSTSSDNAVALVSTGPGAAEGTFNLSVYQLAQSEKLSSTAQANLTSPLGKAGTFTVNGKSVTVVATDTLSDVAGKINSAGGDVTASLLNAGEGNVFLTLTGKTTGANHRIDLADTTGSVLGDLGFLATSVRQAVTNGAMSNGVTQRNAKLGAAFDLTGTTTLKVNGTDVVFDAVNDTLDSFAAKLNAVGGITASVVSATEMGRTVHRLQITGTSGTPTFGTEGDVMTKLGVLKRSSELVTAQDAVFSLDGIAMGSGTNNVSTVIPGATITLNAADRTTPKTSVISIARDLDQTKGAIKAFMDAYNGLLDFIKEQSQFDTETYDAGPLFGDSTTSVVEGQISNLLFNTVPGVDASFSNLSQLGFSIGTDGRMSLNEATLVSALNKNPEAVAKLLQTAGSATGSGLSYVSSGTATVASASPYSVNITQAATRSAVTGFEIMESVTSSDETLTFDGAMFGGKPVNLLIPAGTSSAGVIDLINRHATLKEMVEARVENDRLVIEAKRYGAGGAFTVVSSLPAGIDTTGIGTTGQSTAVTGKDVAGTINGEPATGAGQYLTGNSGNAKTNGLQILYTGSATGDIGTISVTKGIASRTADLLDSFLSGNKSLFSVNDESLQKQIDDLGSSIVDLNSRLALKEEALRTRFANMENAISKARAQASQMSSVLARPT